MDMDAFYASVEQRDRPELRGRPVIVGGPPGSRGVVAACSYEARRFGVHSAMPSSAAYRLCPDAVFIRPRFDAYRAASRIIQSLFLACTDLMEPLSLDEAFLDVTENKRGMDSATRIAQTLKKEILEHTGLTASAGVSFNKFLAKIASDFRKPDGLFVIPPGRADAFIDALPVRKFFGVGRATEKRMLELGVKTGADLKKFGRDELLFHFGKSGSYFFDIAHGRDDRPVTPHRERKSIGKEVTLGSDIDDMAEIMDILHGIAVQLEDLVREKEVRPRTVTLKIRYFDFRTVTRSRTARDPIQTSHEILSRVRRLAEDTDAGQTKIRLLGISLSNFLTSDPAACRLIQLPLPFVDFDAF